ncbi:MAG: ketopantoate reductase family protein [Desulfobacteraceae bacterium]|jgi:2-dehydropantoate 2-reductase|nr:ketopantoate reductase family protein [Desulfobacteraceae bacterium]
MKTIRNVAILGAGAMGAYFAACFAADKSFNLCLIARGERRERLARDGLMVNGRSVFIPAASPEDGPAPADLIIVALKHHHLAAAVADLKPFVGPDTVILSVMNGLESEAIIGAAVGQEKVLYAISVGIDAVRQGNRLSYSNPGRHLFGEADNTVVSDRVRTVQEAFTRAGIAWETPPDMLRMLWWKFMINVGMNQASAAMRAPYGPFQTRAEARDLMEALMREVIALAGPAGVNLGEPDIADWRRVLETLAPGGKTSMLQDVEAGRKTEVEIFGGTVVALGQRHNVPTPVNRTLFQIIRMLEGTD